MQVDPLMDDTRDITIATKTEVAQLRADVSDLKTSMKAIETALAERKGAEKVARWLVGISSGAMSATVVKYGGAILGFPLK